MYFWDLRDGPSYSGWWFGPTVGADDVWCYNAQASALPPASGWTCQQVDDELTLKMYAHCSTMESSQGATVAQ